MTASSALAAALLDAYPVSPGNTLVVPRRHEADFFALSSDEQGAMLNLANNLHRKLQEELGFGGASPGINSGELAGQTVGHAHHHLIPRHQGDVPVPAGGVRWLCPDKAPYWTENSSEAGDR